MTTLDLQTHPSLTHTHTHTHTHTKCVQHFKVRYEKGKHVPVMIV